MGMCPRSVHMGFIIGVLNIATAALSVLRVRVPAGVHPAHLGWMSEQWLAEHRVADHS